MSEWKDSVDCRVADGIYQAYQPVGDALDELIALLPQCAARDELDAGRGDWMQEPFSIIERMGLDLSDY